MLGHYVGWFCLVVLATGADKSEKGCVNHPMSACPVVDITKGKICHCQRIEADTTVICCNIHKDTVLKEGLSCAFNRNTGQATLKVPQTPVTALHILNSTLETLNLESLYITSDFQKLIGLSVTQSNILRIKGKVPETVTCLNLSSNLLKEIYPEVFSYVPHLGYLDLSNNNLTNLPNLTLNPKALFFMDLSGNKKVTCKHLHKLKMQKHTNTSSPTINFVNENDTYCSMNAEYNWFSSTDVIQFRQLETIDEIDNYCPRDQGYQCNCSMTRNVQLIDAMKAQYSVAVDCSGRGLTSLPNKLPPLTVSLNITNNEITDLRALGTNEDYNFIDKLYADNNLIEDITVLEGSGFIERFVHMSLRNNNIKTIPKYLLDNAFDRNSFNIKSVALGKNKLDCNCSTAQVFKVWLLANKQKIPDYEDLLCRNYNNIRIVELDQRKVCVYPRDWTDYIYYIIALEIFLLVMLFTKVSYDYWVFKTKGYLPWPASKMPRLPCDWVFEL